MINLVIALPSEAKPIIDGYRLQRNPGAHGFRMYSNSDIRLVVTGVGRVQAAAGTAYLAGMDPDAGRAWLNIGLAGHGDLPVGTGIVADKVTDHTTGRSWYPKAVKHMPGIDTHLKTYDQPVSRYPPAVACDMEAAAFYAIAARFGSGKAVHCYKVVSDSDSRSRSMVTPRLAEALIGGHLPQIDRAVQALLGLGLDPAAPA